MKWLRYSSLVLLLILIDQLVKYYVTENLTYVVNKGIALSLFQSSIELALMLHVSGIIIVIIYLYKNSEVLQGKKILLISLLMIIAGGIGNLIDRVLWGGVIDYISIWIIPTFNIADSLVTVGVLVAASKILLEKDD